MKTLQTITLASFVVLSSSALAAKAVTYAIPEPFPQSAADEVLGAIHTAATEIKPVSKQDVPKPSKAFKVDVNAVPPVVTKPVLHITHAKDKEDVDAKQLLNNITQKKLDKALKRNLETQQVVKTEEKVNPIT